MRTPQETTHSRRARSGHPHRQLRNAHRVESRAYRKRRRLSGPALFPRTLENVRRLRERFGASIEIIATGGIDAPDKALAALQAGATACAYFTGFITRGPLLARRTLDALVKARR